MLNPSGPTQENQANFGNQLGHPHQFSYVFPNYPGQEGQHYDQRADPQRNPIGINSANVNSASLNIVTRNEMLNGLNKFQDPQNEEDDDDDDEEEEKEVVPPKPKNIFARIGGMTYRMFVGGVRKTPPEIRKLQRRVMKQTKEQMEKLKNLKGLPVNELQGKMVRIRNELKEKITESVKEFLSKYKVALNQWIELKIEDSIIKFLSRILPIIKRAAKDKDMPQFIQKMIDDILDDLWPDLEDYILFVMKYFSFDRDSKSDESGQS